MSDAIRSATATGKSFPALEQYLSHLYQNTQADTRVWLDASGRAQGQFFNSTLTSAFQPIRTIRSGKVVGYEGFARTYSSIDQGLCIWKLLDHAASDDESVELDRLCRMLHAINFFRQPQALDNDLYLSVHARLLAAVDGNHGTAFSRVLKVLGLPQEKIVLQLPVIVEHQSWLLNYVADNYRRNDFRIALNAADAAEALMLIEHVGPELVKLDSRQLVDDGPALRLLLRCKEEGIRVIFKRVENEEAFQALSRLSVRSGVDFYAQGYWWNLPSASLGEATALPKPSIVAEQPLLERYVGG
jgi:EAL domain-containing protein (putative c-di-GMP-specific phosphodiesterase class I)